MPLETTRYRWEDLPLEKVTDMVSRKTVSGADLALTQAYFKKGTLVPVHRQAAEQLIYVLQGVVSVQGPEGEITLREGEVLVVPAGLMHQAEVLDDTFLLIVTRAAAPVPAPPASVGESSGR